MSTATAVETNQHYDLDPAVFAHFLDPMRKYSSALYLSDSDDLATAQRHKLRFVAGRMGVDSLSAPTPKSLTASRFHSLVASKWAT